MNLDELYFKDNFTKEEDKVKLDINKLKVDCIESKNNKFSLDSDGNLNVNSITSVNSNNSNKQDLYPIGAIYLSVNDTNPANYFGGTWEQIAKGRTLVGVDSSDADFNIARKIGGSKFLQQHEHVKNTPLYKYEYSYGFDGQVYKDGSPVQYFDIYSGKVANIQTGNSGNLQPYFTCYIWSRIK